MHASNFRGSHISLTLTGGRFSFLGVRVNLRSFAFRDEMTSQAAAEPRIAATLSALTSPHLDLPAHC